MVGIGGDPEPGGDRGEADLGESTRGGREPRNRTRQPFEGETESPETIAAMTFLERQRAGLRATASELAARRPRGTTLLTGTLGTSSSTQISRRTLG